MDGWTEGGLVGEAAVVVVLLVHSWRLHCARLVITYYWVLFGTYTHSDFTFQGIEALGRELGSFYYEVTIYERVYIIGTGKPAFGDLILVVVLSES
jgi:hypothetical protein